MLAAARLHLEQSMATGGKAIALDAVKTPMAFEEVLNMFQKVMPTLTHCLMYALDLLCLRAGADSHTTAALTG
jgi:hypothetical protein